MASSAGRDLEHSELSLNHLHHGLICFVNIINICNVIIFFAMTGRLRYTSNCNVSYCTFIPAVNWVMLGSLFLLDCLNYSLFFVKFGDNLDLSKSISSVSLCKKNFFKNKKIRVDSHDLVRARYYPIANNEIGKRANTQLHDWIFRNFWESQSGDWLFVLLKISWSTDF